MSKDEKKLQIRNSTAEFLIFTGQAGEKSIEARYEDETIWLTQKLMATLFEVTVPTINEHLKNIFASGELTQDSAIRKFRITAADGKKYSTKLYNLDAIISVGYRMNSVRATQFRQWATHVLREFAIKGFVLDKKRLENGTFLGEDDWTCSWNSVSGKFCRIRGKSQPRSPRHMPKVSSRNTASCRTVCLRAISTESSIRSRTKNEQDLGMEGGTLVE